MTERVYPSTKPNGTTAAAPPIPNPPPTKTHLYNPTRQPYRPTPTRQKHHHRRFSCRRFFCITCFWSILLLIGILLLASIAAAAFYVLYHPHPPTFSVTSLKISTFNLTTTPSDDTTLTTKLNLTLSVKNPNKNIIYFYDPISISVRSNSLTLSNGTFTNFTSSPGSVFPIRTTMALSSPILDTDAVNSLKSDLKRKNGLPMNIVVDTMVGVKMEKLKMKKVGIRVKCEGIHGLVPMGKIVIPVVAKTSKAKCEVDLRIKIWKLTF
ncbi:hypothetical protein ACJIZ3_004857 [Penstemon smallii]|uniref:Late embryogenesis abundant protein LEA-2 subgroup domain-containing protein n=1 Tax=Penstemon smallii TaxID=265156 RepID=A0ABD3S3C9_9LAMI